MSISSSVLSCQGEVVTCEPGDGPPWTDWGDLTEAETQHWAEDGDLSPAQARPGPPGSEARLSPEPVARVRRAPMWAWATPWHQLLHPAHGNTDTYRPLIGQTQPSLASDWLMRTTPGPLVPLCQCSLCHLGVARVSVTLTHVSRQSRAPEAGCDVLWRSRHSLERDVTTQQLPSRLLWLRMVIITNYPGSGAPSSSPEAIRHQGSTSNTLFHQTRHTICEVQYHSHSMS